MSAGLIRQLERYGDHFESVLHTLETEVAVVTVTTERTKQSLRPTGSRRRPGWVIALAAFVTTVAMIGGVAVIFGRASSELLAPAGEPGSVVRYGSAHGIDDGCAQVIGVRDAELWLAGHCGLMRFDETAWNLEAQLPDGFHPHEIVAGPDGSIWLGATAGGVVQFDGESVIQHDVVAPFVAVTADGTVWARPIDREPFQQLLRYDGQWAEVVEAGAVGEVVVGGDGALWVTADEEPEPDAALPARDYVLRRFDGSWTTFRVPDDIEAGRPKPAPNGIALGVGAVFDGVEWTQTQATEAPSLSDLAIAAIQLDDGDSIDGWEWADEVIAPNGDLWLASSFYGALRFDGTIWTHYSTDSGLASNQLTFVTVGSDGSVWLGSHDAGLSRILRDE
jgi:streptogramin lyase